MCHIGGLRSVGKRMCRLKRQDRAGATLKGQRRIGRPHDSWRTPTTIVTGKLWKCEISDPRKENDHWDE